MNAAPCKSFHHSHVYDDHWVGTFEKRQWEGEVGGSPDFHCDDEGVVRVAEGSAMPNVLSIATELLDAVHEPRWLQRNGDTVEVQLADGRWIYQIEGWRDRRAEAVCRIQYREES